MTTHERVADVVAHVLRRAGVRVAFGVPGGEVLTLMDALGRAGIDMVLARQESAAALMAQGVARETGAPGVLVATVGPGATSAVNGVAAATQDRVPLLALTGALDTAELEAGYTHQALDQQALFAPVTKRSVRLEAAGAGRVIADAIALATTPRAGAVHVDLGSAVAAARSTGSGSPPSSSAAPSEVAAPALDALDAIASRLLGAARPLVMLGLDALEPAAREAARELVRATGAPVLTTYLAKGVIDEHAAEALGAFGLSPAIDAALLPLVRRSDVILRLGYDPIETRSPWTRPFDPSTVLLDVASVAAGPAEPRSTHAASGALGSLCRALTARLRERSAERARRATWEDGSLATARAALLAAWARMDATPAGRLVAALARALPPDARVTVDTGAHRILLSQRWRASAPGLLVQSTGLCTMACALPLALGIRRAAPGIPVVAVMGDGGLEMTLGELASARELGGPLLVVVLDDRALELIALKQRSMALAPSACESSGTDFAAVARALGGRGVRVESADALGPAVADALAADRFTVLHCPIPRGSYDGVL